MVRTSSRQRCMLNGSIQSTLACNLHQPTGRYCTAPSPWPRGVWKVHISRQPRDGQVGIMGFLLKPRPSHLSNCSLLPRETQEQGTSHGIHSTSYSNQHPGPRHNAVLSFLFRPPLGSTMLACCWRQNYPLHRLERTCATWILGMTSCPPIHRYA